MAGWSTAIDQARLAAEEDEEQVAIAAITASELLHGVHRLRGASARTRAERFVEALVAAMPSLPAMCQLPPHQRLDIVRW